MALSSAVGDYVHVSSARSDRHHLVPLSCKTRGLCPSCGGRRMPALTPHIMDFELPHVPVRVHYHLLCLDGWFHRRADGPLAFVRVPTPSQTDIERLVAVVHARVTRLLERRGLLEAGAPDPLAEDASALSACYEGAVLQRVALGPLRGRPVMKLGQPLAAHLASAATRVERAGALCARLDGFDLHGQLAFGAGERARIEQLVRYCARPPLANDRLEKLPDGRYLLTLKAAWRDGTTHLRFDPIELMERLAAQIPKPRVSLVLYADVLAPDAKLRREVVGYARAAALPDAPMTQAQTRGERETRAELMRVTFQLDVLTCPRCGVGCATSPPSSMRAPPRRCYRVLRADCSACVCTLR